MEGGAFSSLVEPFKNLVGHIAPGGFALVVVVVGAQVVVEAVKHALGERFGEWLKNLRNLLLAALVLAVGAYLVMAGRIWTPVALTVCFALYVVVKWRKWPLFDRGRNIAVVIAGVVAILGAAYWHDLYDEDQRYASYDTAYLLAPLTMNERDNLFKTLRARMKLAFDGVKRVRVGPEKVEYGIEEKEKLLTVTIDGLRPAIFIGNRFYSYPPATADAELHFSMDAFRRQKGSDEIILMSDWNIQPFSTTGAGLEGALMRGNFELIVFLSAKGLLQLTPEARDTVWRNILREYTQFIRNVASSCEVHAKLTERIAAKQALQEKEVRELLAEGCKEFEGKSNRQAEHAQQREALNMLLNAE